MDATAYLIGPFGAARFVGVLRAAERIGGQDRYYFFFEEDDNMGFTLDAADFKIAEWLGSHMQIHGKALVITLKDESGQEPPDPPLRHGPAGLDPRENGP